MNAIERDDSASHWLHYGKEKHGQSKTLLLDMNDQVTIRRSACYQNETSPARCFGSFAKSTRASVTRGRDVNTMVSR
jgi:hypothetical protein